MKKSIITLFLCCFSAISFAQLKVDSLGRTFMPKGITVGSLVPEDHVGLSVQYNKSETTPYFGIKSTLTKGGYMPTNHICAIYGIAKHQTSTGNMSCGKRSIGVLGAGMHALSLSGDFCAGIAGVGSIYNGIGVYGTTDPTGNPFTFLPTSSLGGAYAGYFQGNVKITGALTTNMVTQTSDARLKENIFSISKEIGKDILALNPVSFKYAKDSLYYWYQDSAEAVTHTHYGLVAQEVKEVFPDLVYEDGNGMLSVNYLEIIPLLISTVKEQEARITELENASAKDSLVRRVKAAEDKSDMLAVEAELFQNTPNPFTDNTAISYFLPNEVSDAAIYIYDMQGTQLQKHVLTQRGNATLTISGGTLNAGMYLYSLIADGKAIDTKRMILTK